MRSKLERLQDEAQKALDKISRKEGLLSRSFQGQTGDYRAHSDQLRENQTAFATVSKNVEELENELTEINNRLDHASKKIDDTGKTFSDNTPLQNIKKAITTVKNDIKSIDIRIGVVSNTLLQLKLKEKSKIIEDDKQLEILDNEYEVEIWYAIPLKNLELINAHPNLTSNVGYSQIKVCSSAWRRVSDMSLIESE